jgi:hypothetical protein
MDCNPVDSSYTAGIGFALLAEAWQFFPYAVGIWLSALRDFLVDPECTLEIAIHTQSAFVGPRPHPHR